MIPFASKNIRWPLTIAALVLLVCACRRTGPGAALVGEWRLIEEQGGITGADIHISPDSAVYLTLNSDQSYQARRFGSLIGSGTYRVAITPAFPSNSPVPAIAFDGGAYTPYQLSIFKLVIGTAVDDGIQHIYVRNN